MRVLAAHFAAAFAAELGRPGLALTDPALDQLAAHAWPGNVRELRNVIERAAVLCEGDAIGPDDLPPDVGRPGPAAGGASSGGSSGSSSGGSSGGSAPAVSSLAGAAVNAAMSQQGVPYRYATSSPGVFAIGDIVEG